MNIELITIWQCWEDGVQLYDFDVDGLKYTVESTDDTYCVLDIMCEPMSNPSEKEQIIENKLISIVAEIENYKEI